MNTNTVKKRGIVSRFFRFLWRSLRVFNTIVFGIFTLAFIALIISGVVNGIGKKLPVEGALVLHPAGALVEQETAVSATTALLQDNDLPQQSLVRDLTDALALAKDDDRIELVVLELDKLQNGFMSKLETVAAAIEDFKTSNKKVIAVADNYSQSALYLAAHADEVLLHSEGVALIEGFAMQRLYFKSFLEKHDVSVNVFKVGKYKSALEIVTRDDMSEEDRESLTGIIEPWWQAYTSGIEKARSLPAGTVDALMQNLPEQVSLSGGNLAQLMLDKGLVDHLVTSIERRQYLNGLTGEEDEAKSFKQISYKDYLRVSQNKSNSADKKIAVVTAVGNIVNGNAPAGQIGDQSLIKLIRKARLDEDVSAIVLRVDSGGGSKTASEIIRSELQVAQDAGIPVVASMGSLAASGGYWISATADEIWASPTTLTGSIGIFGMLPTFEKTLEKYGINSDGVTTTPIAGGTNPLTGVTPEVSSVLQAVTESGYQQFLDTVAIGRDMEVDAVHKIAQGRLWTGQKAKELGLVDELGELEHAISAAAQLADVEEYSVWHVKPDISFEQQIIKRIAENASTSLPKISSNPMHQITSVIRKELDIFKGLNDPTHSYVICGNCPRLP